ncbi:hypothetical protein E4U56_008233 [Claviceps arundinis]|uniref:Uncharacterized protein n=1 Tax=Claviceps arundinis TaxID=1623583 RepID=A0A9P7SQQ8_9HYPO|nr:hypothetical protein E4U56_008233 [Claviceps arundinis]
MEPPDRGSVRDMPAHAAAPDYLRRVDTPMLRDRFQALVDLLLSPRAGGGYPPQPRQSFFGYGPKNSEDPYALNRTFDIMHRFEDLYTEKNKYIGKELDFFVPKFQLFCDRCRIYSVPEDALRRLFPTMLTGRAGQYYVHYLSMTSMGFDEIVLAIHAHFETSCDHDMILEDLTLQKIMAENRGKTQLECFELLISG